MAAFINKKSGPPSTELKDQASLDKIIAAGGIVAFVSGEDSTEYKNWVRAATSGQLEDFQLAHTFANLAGGKYKNTVVIFRVGDDPLQFSEEKLSKTKLVSWIIAEGYPAFEEVSQPVWQRAQNADKPIVVLFVDMAKKEEANIVKEVAKEYKGKVVVTYGPMPAQKSLAERWGASGNFFPTAIVADWKHSTNPIMTIFNEETEDELTSESAISFVKTALEDKYESYLKSEPVPKDEAGPVVTLVGKTIEKELRDPEKDVFIEFYAPWCGHCKKLAPVWDELAQTLKGVDHVKIAKIDATANNLPKNVAVRGYPTLIYFPTNNKDAGVPYNGERDLESLTKFVIEQSTKPIKLKKDEL